MPEWISVKDELPCKRGSYIVATDKGAVCTSHWYGDCFSGAHIRPHITHWMPLPNPPKYGKCKDCAFYSSREAYCLLLEDYHGKEDDCCQGFLKYDEQLLRDGEA